jgi:hypothetical protein
MSPVQHRRLLRLEKLAAPVIDRVNQADEACNRQIQRDAAVHAVNFAAIVHHGDPEMDEPLSKAWPRCIRSGIWRDFANSALLPLLTPFNNLGARTLAEYLYENWVPTLPGANEKEKFDPIFANAPLWLIWFTYADWTAGFLNFDLPDLSQIENFARCSVIWKIWPCLPEGKFDLCPRRTDYDDLGISVRDFFFFEEMQGVPGEAMTRQERKRFLSVSGKILARDLEPLP